MLMRILSLLAPLLFWPDTATPQPAADASAKITLQLAGLPQYKDPAQVDLSAALIREMVPIKDPRAKKRPLLAPRIVTLVLTNLPGHTCQSTGPAQFNAANEFKIDLLLMTVENTSKPRDTPPRDLLMFASTPAPHGARTEAVLPGPPNVSGKLRSSAGDYQLGLPAGSLKLIIEGEAVLLEMNAQGKDSLLRGTVPLHRCP